MSDSTNLIIPNKLIKKAKGLGINCSFEARKALQAAVKQKEEIVRASASKPIPDDDQPTQSRGDTGQC